MGVYDFLLDNTCTVKDEVLPLVHTRSHKTAKDILPKKKLERKLCEVFNEYLLYFFYARPAYRLDDVLKIPVVFIIKPILNDIKRVYPFDSGAYNEFYVKTGRLNEKNLCVDKEYELPNNFFAIQRYVNAIFGNNNNYHYGICKTHNELPMSVVQHRAQNSDLDKLLNLVAEKKKDGIDDRRKTVEIQSVNDYDFSDKLLAIIAPEGGPFQELQEILLNSGFKQPLLPYSYRLHDNTEKLAKAIYKAIEKYYASQNYGISIGGGYTDDNNED